LLVASRVGNAHQQRLDLFDVIDLADEVKAKAVPSACVLVPQVLLDAATQVDREADIVEAVVLVNRQ